MLYDPEKKKNPKQIEKPKSKFNEKAFQRLKHIKQTLFYKKEKK